MVYPLFLWRGRSVPLTGGLTPLSYAPWALHLYLNSRLGKCFAPERMATTPASFSFPIIVFTRLIAG